MKSMERVIKEVTSNANSTISANINPSIQHNQTYGQNNETQREHNNTNSTSHINVSKWTLSSLEASARIDPVKVQCEKGAILKQELCGKILFF